MTINMDKINKQLAAKRNIRLLMSDVLYYASDSHDWIGIWENMEIIKNQHMVKDHPFHIADEDIFIDAIADTIVQASPDEIARIIYVLLGIEKSLFDLELETEIEFMTDDEYDDD